MLKKLFIAVAVGALLSPVGLALSPRTTRSHQTDTKLLLAHRLFIDAVRKREKTFLASLIVGRMVAETPVALKQRFSAPSRGTKGATKGTTKCGRTWVAREIEDGRSD